MHNNYYFLRGLSKALAAEMIGLELAECFSQNKDELIMGWCSAEKEFWIRATLQADLALLTFPADFQRAKKNSVNIFHQIIGKKVESIRQFLNERSFVIHLSDGYALLFKLYGNKANIIVFENEQVIDLFQHKFEHDHQTQLSTIDRPIDQTFEGLQKQGLRATFPTFGKEIYQYFLPKNINEQTPEQQFEHIKPLLSLLENPVYYITSVNGVPQLLLFEYGEVQTKTTNPIIAANEFIGAFSKKYYIEKEKATALRELEKKQKQGQSYLLKNEEKLTEITQEAQYEQIAHLIMANLHAIPARAKSVELQNFYTGKPIKIKLNEKLSPQKNAENYYRKAKNQKIEIANLEKNITQKRRELEAIKIHQTAILQIDNVKELRKYLRTSGITSDDNKQDEVSLFKCFDYEGFEILVGKNAKNNDILTQKYAYKEDLWLHARDVSGSHVLLKYQAGKPFPHHVIEKAASLAAYYSQRRNESLCPVICTPKKFVRKPKGLAPGQVVIDRETVLMVTPHSFDE
jgi:predicted ribosome quality control (RQC) complex YloA/Tae2 family protein